MNQSTYSTSIDSIAYVEMLVANVFNSKNFFANALKFKHIATKKDDKSISFLMKQGNIHIILTSAYTAECDVSQTVHQFGDCVSKISFWVFDPEACFASALDHGAHEMMPPQYKDGRYLSSIELFNGVEHEFLMLDSNSKIPGFSYDDARFESDCMLYEIDHIATCHPINSIKKYAEFYKKAFGFTENTDEDIHSEDSGMHITIMQSPNGKINLPLVEPSSDRSVLHTYLKHNHGSGVHHIAFETDDIISTLQHYENSYGELRKALPKYYEELHLQYPELRKYIDQIAPHGIMLEKDDKGILFQIFTKPVVTRPTLFLEFVQRDKCQGFGSVNIKALYDTLTT